MPLGDAGREMARGLRTPARVTVWIADSVGECVRPLGQQFLPGRDGLYHGFYISLTIIFEREYLNQSCRWCGVAPVLAFPQLTCVVAAHEQVNGSRQRADAAGEASGTSHYIASFISQWLQSK